MTQHFDVIVIGGGSAGYNAARTLGSAGKRVALIDKGPLGGLCILRGCMPTKAMLRSTDVLTLVREAAEFGLDVSGVTFDFEAIMERQARLVKGFQDYRVQGIQKIRNGTLIMGEARFTGPDSVEVAGETYTADHFLLSVGSVPQILEVPGLKEAGCITSDQVMGLRELPKSLLVWGGGVIALELGQFFARLGVEVTMVIRAEHVLSKEDLDVQEAVEAALQHDGIRLLRRVRPVEVRREGDRKVVRLEGPEGTQEVVVDEIMSATGRAPHLDPLNLEAAGIETPGGRIAVDSRMCTSNPRVYAAGDCLGDFFLVHVAIYQAEVAAQNMLGREREVDYRLLASSIFTEPNVARVGLSERECQDRGLEVIVGKYSFEDLGKAECMGSGAMHGFVKLVALADTGEIVGATIVGPEGADLIHELIVAMEFRCTVERLMSIPHLHPTLAEIITYPAEEIAEVRASRVLS